MCECACGYCCTPHSDDDEEFLQLISLASGDRLIGLM